MLVFRTKCPAKVNLSLSVLGRDDAAGMHYLDSVLAKIDLCDEITVRILTRAGMTVKFHRSAMLLHHGEPSPRENTVIRAYHALSEAVNHTLPGMSVEVKKAIPAGFGLGGASSDAAGFLRLIHFLATRTAALPSAAATAIAALEPSQFTELAARVGADVPSFLLDGPVRVQGFGEVVAKQELLQLADYHVLLVFPPQPLYTKDMYARFDERGEKSSNHTARFLEKWQESGAAEALPLAHNDFEEVARQELPAVGEAIDSLRKRGFPLVSLTGTGSCVFALMKGESPAEELGLPSEVRISGPHSLLFNAPTTEA